MNIMKGALAAEAEATYLEQEEHFYTLRNGGQILSLRLSLHT